MYWIWDFQRNSNSTSKVMAKNIEELVYAAQKACKDYLTEK